MSFRLAHRSGPLKGKKEAFDQDLIRIGRKSDNDVVLDDSVVSSSHAEIRRREGRYLLTDLGSTNGTFLNGKRIERSVLNDRDSVQIGKDGPVLEFQARQSGFETGKPRLVPISGSWEPRGEQELAAGRVRLGRGKQNDIIVGRSDGSIVSTEHAELRVSPDRCEIEDLDSTNGTFVNGERIRTARLRDCDRVELGKGGPVFEFRVGAHSRKSQRAEARGSEAIFRKLDRAAKGGPAGDRTMMILRAANKYYKRRRWPLLAGSGIVLVAAVAAGVYGLVEKRENDRLRELANFYKVRELDVEIVGQRETKSEEELRVLRERKLKLLRDYERYLEKIGWYENKTPVERAVMNLARRLGETDLAVPPDFIQTVQEYVGRWRSTAKLRSSMDRARERDLNKRIVSALDQHGLPREFLFLALQESGFNASVVGPRTKFGIAKGLWQFIPGTAVQYGLKVGPLKDETVYDASDQRHNEDLSTQAAARYLAYLYTSKAAASGMLVIASYNYGETRIINRLDSLPNDPRQRNFWNFYRNGWIPPETRDYVMYIFSAALICEKRELFQVNIEPCF